jgi:hypothetical protein
MEFIVLAFLRLASGWFMNVFIQAKLYMSTINGGSVMSVLREHVSGMAVCDQPEANR